MNKAICLMIDTHYKATRKALASLSCCEKIKEWTLIIRVDPQCPRVIALIRSFQESFKTVEVFVNPTKYGPTINFFKTLYEAMAKHEKILVIHSNYILTTDSFHYLDKALEISEKNREIFAVNLLGGTSKENPSKITKSKHLYSECFSILTKRMIPFINEFEDTGKDLKIYLKEYILKNNLKILTPVSSRALKFGDDYKKDPSFERNSSFYGEFEL